MGMMKVVAVAGHRREEADRLLAGADLLQAAAIPAEAVRVLLHRDVAALPAASAEIPRGSSRAAAEDRAMAAGRDPAVAAAADVDFLTILQKSFYGTDIDEIAQQ